MKINIRHLLCERTDVLVWFWLFVGAFFVFRIMDLVVGQKFDWWLETPLVLFIWFMYYYIAIKFNEWRENYCAHKVIKEEDRYDIESKSEHELLNYISGYKESTPQYIAGMQELNRRNNKTSDIKSSWALIFAGLSLLVVAIALFK